MESHGLAGEKLNPFGERGWCIFGSDGGFEHSGVTVRVVATRSCGRGMKTKNK